VFAFGQQTDPNFRRQLFVCVFFQQKNVLPFFSSFFLLSIRDGILHFFKKEDEQEPCHNHIQNFKKKKESLPTYLP